MRVCVYCGSSAGRRPEYADAARRLGHALAVRGIGLVYGGGHVGLMGAVADAVVDTMHQRKQMMAERADAFLALPGGIGTLEELFEVWTWRQIGYHDQPIGLLNVAGFYDGLLSFMRHTVDSGFLEQKQLDSLLVTADPATLLDRLQASCATATEPDQYRDI